MSITQEDAGKTSSIRVVNLIWIIAVAITWGYCSIAGGEIQDLPSNILFLTIALVTGKLIQKPFETKK